MDIQKEIEKFSTIGYNALAEDFKKEAEQLRVKKYLFRSINLIKELDYLIENDVFDAQNIQFVRLHQESDLTEGQVFSQIELLDSQKQTINIKSNNDFIREYKLLCGLFGRYSFQIETDLSKCELSKDFIDIELNHNAKHQLKSYLLNEELRKAYDYIILLEKNPQKNHQEKSVTRKI